jgi:regulator of RNase E activity RraA
VVADSDGVAVVPRAQAPAVLALAQQMDFKEHSMYAVIEQLKSIVAAVKQFGRL